MFATQDISIGTIIGTYRGPVVATAKTQEELEKQVMRNNLCISYSGTSGTSHQKN